jgi:hypothetical protein
MKHSIRTVLLTAGAIGLLSLGACKGSEPEPAPVETNATEELPELPVQENFEEPAPIPTPSETPAPIATPEPVAPDEQMLDDADAVGMTSRLPRGDVANEAAPAEGD